MTPLKPLFSMSCDLVGWVLPARFVFAADMGYLGFIASGGVWSGTTGAWLGPADGHNIHDADGLAVAWTPDSPLRRIGRPMMPARVSAPTRPVRPVRPVMPMRPLGVSGGNVQWSPLSFAEWANGGPFPVVEEPLDETAPALTDNLLQGQNPAQSASPEGVKSNDADKKQAGDANPPG